MAAIKDPKLDPNEMIENADYQVKVRDMINNYGGNKYGITNDMIGWNRTDPKSNGMVTLGGQNLLAPDRLENGSSWASNDAVRKAVDLYAKQRGIEAKSTATTPVAAPAVQSITQPIDQSKYNLQNNGYKDQYSSKIDSLLNSIMEAKPFAYDQANDPSFKAYQQQYAKAGDNALANTMAEASSLTGGRLNSWAVSAGQGAKANFDQDLMNIIPQLEQQAYARHQGDLNDKRSNISMLSNLDNDLYRRAVDTRSFAYGVDRDALSDARYADETNYDRGRDTLSDTRYNDDKIYDRARDVISDTRYADDKNYNRGRDTLSDKRYDDDKTYNRGRDVVSDTRYVDETKYNRNQDTIKRNDTLKENSIDNARQDRSLAIQKQNQARNIFESDRDYKYKVDQAAKESGADPQELGIMYNSMFSGIITDQNGKVIKENASPSEWLKHEAPYLNDSDLLALEKLLPQKTYLEQLAELNSTNKSPNK